MIPAYVKELAYIGEVSSVLRTTLDTILAISANSVACKEHLNICALLSPVSCNKYFIKSPDVLSPSLGLPLIILIFIFSLLPHFPT